MPARSCGSPATAGIAMRTGMRCTTLTQLPVAFCGGSTENSAPVAWADARDGAVPFALGIGVDLDRDRLARLHVGQSRSSLKLASIHRPDRRPRSSSAVPGAAILAGLRHVAGDAGERRADDGVLEVECRLVARRLGLEIARLAFHRQVGIAAEARHDLRDLLFHHGDLLAGHVAVAPGVVELGLGGELLAEQRVLAREIALGEVGVAACDLQLGLLLLIRGLEPGDVLARRLEGGIGTGERHPVGAVVDREQRCALGDVLVLGDRHLGDGAGHFGADGNLVGLARRRSRSTRSVRR